VVVGFEANTALQASGYHSVLSLHALTPHLQRG
jgi:hypothetical protein